VFVSFLGYAKIATVAEELKNPGRNLLIAIIGSVAIVTVLYAILVTLMLGVVSWPELSQDAPVAQAAQMAFPASVGPVGGVAAAAATVMTLGALLATASSANASILASARINFAMGRDRIVTNWLNEIHPNYATPYRSILVTGAMIVVFIALLGRDIEILAKAASVLHLIVYALMNVALIVFREADPEYDPEFTVPFYPVTPVLGALLALGLVAFMDEIEIALSGVFVVVALGWYALYARSSRTPLEGVLSSYLRDEETDVPGPVVDAADAVAPNGGEGPTIMVALSNPERKAHSSRSPGPWPPRRRTRGGDARRHRPRPDATRRGQRASSRGRVGASAASDAKRDAEAFDVSVETRSILSHRGSPRGVRRGDGERRRHARDGVRWKPPRCGTSRRGPGRTRPRPPLRRPRPRRGDVRSGTGIDSDCRRYLLGPLGRGGRGVARDDRGVGHAATRRRRRDGGTGLPDRVGRRTRPRRR